MLVEHWAGLRGNGTEAASPSRTPCHQGNRRRMTLDQTGTTGPGKPVRPLTAVVDPECYVANPGWLAQ
eukprot:5980164-Heterocapsa_arctica.AAC.1